MTPADVGRLVGRQIIDRTANGPSEGLRAVMERIRIVAPRAEYLVTGRHFLSRGAAGGLVAEIVEADANGPASVGTRCRISMHGPEPEGFGAVTVGSEWLGFDDGAFPDDAGQVAERLARLGRLLVAGDVVDDAAQDGVPSAQIVTDSEKAMLAAHYVADMSIRSTVLPPEASVLVIARGAVGRGAIRYDGMDEILPPAVGSLLRDMPRSAVVSLNGDVLEIDPICYRLSGTQDVVEAMRNVAAIDERFGATAAKIAIP